MKRLLILGVAMVGMAGAANAQDDKNYQCQKPGDARTVSIQYSKPGSAQGCSVLYKKVASSADPAKELWHYQSHSDQCEIKAQDFIKKLEGLGLTCTEAKDK